MQIGHGPPFVRESLFGGHGRVLVWDLLRGRVAPPFTAVLSCVLEEKGYVGRHVQHEYDEIVVGLTGYGEARVNGKTQPFGPGAVVYLPLGSALELVNEAPDKELRYLIIKGEHRGTGEEQESAEAYESSAGVEGEPELQHQGEPEYRPRSQDEGAEDEDDPDAEAEGEHEDTEGEDTEGEDDPDAEGEESEPEREGAAAVAGVIEDDD